jgi:hypothetical protein
MSDKAQAKLTELINTLVTAVRLVTDLDDTDPLRRAVFTALLEANLRDTDRVTRMLEAIGAPRKIQQIGERLTLIRTARSYGDTVRCFTCGSLLSGADAATADAWLRQHERRHDAAVRPGDVAPPAVLSGRAPLAYGRCGAHNLPVLYNLAFGYARHVDTPGGSDCDRWDTITAHTPGDTERTEVKLAVACGHAWHAMVLDHEQPFDDACPGGCGATVTRIVRPLLGKACGNCGAGPGEHCRPDPVATVDDATVATDVDASGDCEHPWHSTSTPAGEPFEPTCPGCGDIAHPGEMGPGAEPAADDTHNGDYVVTSVDPGRPVLHPHEGDEQYECTLCGRVRALHPDRAQTPEELAVAAGVPPTWIDARRRALGDPTAAVPPGIYAAAVARDQCANGMPDGWGHLGGPDCTYVAPIPRAVPPPFEPMEVRTDGDTRDWPPGVLDAARDPDAVHCPDPVTHSAAGHDIACLGNGGPGAG